MMKLKKIGAIVLAVMMIAMVGLAYADGEATLTNGEVGGFNPGHIDQPQSQSKTVKLLKEITVYNLDEEQVYAPTITYSYAIEPGTAGVSITDENDDHNPKVAVTAPTKAGVGRPTITPSLSWITSDEMNASTNGMANTKPIIVDFSTVVFSGAGVYRYKITETPHVGVDSYTKTGVTEGNTNHVRFLDVYVKPSSSFAPLSDTKSEYVPADWDIYGYVCIDDGADGNTAITPATTTKTNGFVDSDTNTTDAVSTADKYYTYNLTISKTVENDAYAASTHKFPFTVIFTNSDITQNVLLKTQEQGTVTDFTHNAGTPTWSGHADLLSGGSIKYIGIPMGTDVEVYETNDVAGAIYTVTTTRTNATTQTATENAITSGTEISTATQANPKPAYQSTKTVIDTTKDADDDNAHSVAITNTLKNISPTGLVVRFAPYALILVGGIVLLIIAKKRKPAKDDEE